MLNFEEISKTYLQDIVDSKRITSVDNIMQSQVTDIVHQLNVDTNLVEVTVVVLFDEKTRGFRALQNTDGHYVAEFYELKKREASNEKTQNAQ